jgi:hypothetical protein
MTVVAVYSPRSSPVSSHILFLLCFFLIFLFFNVLFTLSVSRKSEDGTVIGSETKYVEMGAGELHINTFDLEGKKKARMVLRAEKTQRLVLNAAINEKIINVSQPSEKHVRFHSFDLDGKLATFLLKFPGKNESLEVIKNINKAVEFTKA